MLVKGASYVHISCDNVSMLFRHLKYVVRSHLHIVTLMCNVISNEKVMKYVLKRFWNPYVLTQYEIICIKTRNNWLHNPKSEQLQTVSSTQISSGDLDCSIYFSSLYMYISDYRQYDVKICCRHDTDTLSALLASCAELHQFLVDTPQKGPVTCGTLMLSLLTTERNKQPDFRRFNIYLRSCDASVIYIKMNYIPFERIRGFNFSTWLSKKTFGARTQWKVNTGNVTHHESYKMTLRYKNDI